MKTKLTLAMLMLCFVSTWSHAQTKISKLAPAKESPNFKKPQRQKEVFTKKSAVKDTLLYSFVKEEILGNSNYFSFDLWQEDNEAMSQAYTAPAEGLKIHGATFYGKRSSKSTVTCNVMVSVFKADTSNRPIGNALASKTVNVTNNLGFYYVNFNQAVNITGNYAIVISPSSTNAVFSLYLNNIAVGQAYDENFATFKSSYSSYGSYNNWIQTTAITGLTQKIQCEGIIAPIVSYDVQPQATLSTSETCVGNTIDFNNTTKTDLISDRMYNYNKFMHHFGKASTDSTFAWEMGDSSNPIWTKNASHTYNTSGTHTAKLHVLSGFWNGYYDAADFPINIQDKDDANFSYPSVKICNGSANVLPNAIATSGGQFSSTLGLVFANTSTGEINVATSTPGIYNITYTTPGTCPNNSTQTIEILAAINDAVTTTSTTLTAVEQGQNISYQWINCTTGNPISGATAQSYTPTQNGNYAVKISNGNCEITSACYNIAILATSNNNKESLNIYPNPADKIINIDGLTSRSTINILDYNGRIISTQTIDPKKTEINVQNLPKGTYIIQIDSKTNKETRKFIKK